MGVRRRTVIMMIRRLGVLGVVAAALVAPGAVAGPRAPLAVVTWHGGLCATGSECRSTLRVTDTAIGGDGYRSRPITATERRALIDAIRRLDGSYFRMHPFTGTCPIAYDGSEVSYRFRGFGLALRSCTYDLRGVEA